MPMGAIGFKLGRPDRKCFVQSTNHVKDQGFTRYNCQQGQYLPDGNCKQFELPNFQVEMYSVHHHLFRQILRENRW